MTGFNMAATGMYGLYPNIYNNQIALNDLTGFDMYYPTGMGIDPMMTMNGSIFGSGMMMPSMGVSPVMPGMMPGVMPSMSGGSYEDYYKQYEKYQDFMIDSQVRQQQKMRNADLRLNAPQEGIQAKAMLLHDKILRNEQQQIKQAYQDYVNSVRNMYGDADESQIMARANALYAQINGGKTVIDDIRANGRDSFTQGFLQTVTLGFADKKTAEENVSELTGQPVGRKEKAKKFAGNIAGGALFGGAAFLGFNSLCKALKICSKSRTAWGIVAGAIAGLGAAFATSKN